MPVEEVAEHLVRDARSDHPLPWEIEYDWTAEVHDANGDIVTKCFDGAVAEFIITIANRQEEQAEETKREYPGLFKLTD